MKWAYIKLNCNVVLNNLNFVINCLLNILTLKTLCMNYDKVVANSLVFRYFDGNFLLSTCIFLFVSVACWCRLINPQWMLFRLHEKHLQLCLTAFNINI